LGIVFAKIGRWQEAIEAYTRCATVFRQCGNSSDEAIVSMNLGNVFQGQQRWTEALASFERALAIHRSLGDSIGQGETLNNLAFLAMDMNDPKLARCRALESAAVLQGTHDTHLMNQALEILRRTEATPDSCDRT
jgi:tetratricopeptide (TPR) repeat protein